MNRNRLVRSLVLALVALATTGLTTGCTFKCNYPANDPSPVSVPSDNDTGESVPVSLSVISFDANTNSFTLQGTLSKKPIQNEILNIYYDVRDMTNPAAPALVDPDDVLDSPIALTQSTTFAQMTFPLSVRVKAGLTKQYLLTISACNAGQCANAVQIVGVGGLAGPN